MKKLGLNEVREAYLSFFESKGHLRRESFSLVPDGDRSVLLINAGMTPLKKYFTGEIPPPRQRMTTCQKCIRTPDIERVGITARHGTYFEMLGNFSFGDYFKREAIAWAWEFLTKTLEMPPDRLWVTVYEEDDEAQSIWNKEIGVPLSRILRLGKKDNFWEHGAGPCGPCSEIHYDRGESFGCGHPNCAPGCDCDRFMEIWNLVFTQFDSDGNGAYTRLAAPNIDTGMGLERLACVMQDVNNLFEVDTVRNIMNAVCTAAKRKYTATSENGDISLRVITDHIRSSTFLVGDGVLPSNEGRGYVLRRLLRRAARHGRLLGIKGTFLSEIADVVARENFESYPELTERLAYIKRVIGMEEERFAATVDAGMGRLGEIVTAIKALDAATITGTGVVISGDEAFKLHDTFGFPIDLTREIAAENGLTVDEEAFSALIKEQKKRARAARGRTEGWQDGTAENLAALPKTEFVGYEYAKTTARVVTIISLGESVETFAADGGNIDVILDRTPSYGESGGQVGDTGHLYSPGFDGTVTDTKKQNGIFIHKIIGVGTLSVGDSVTIEIDSSRRNAIRRNHTATHLLQAALRTVLGEHVHQAGSYVTPDALRFDFTHFEAVSHSELTKIEEIVNNNILSSLPVTVRETDIEAARKSGATALFGEKYGTVVRVVSIGVDNPVSIEFCGGTHLDNSSGAGLFKITSESSVASGVRRIEAVTGRGVLSLIEKKDAAFRETERKNAEALSEARRQIERTEDALALSRAAELISSAENLDGMGIKVVRAKIDGLSPDAARSLCDKLRDRGCGVAFIAAVSADKALFVCACSPDAVAKGVKAGNIVREIAAIAGGGGGGRPDFASAGAKELAKVDDALRAVIGVVSGKMKRY